MHNAAEPPARAGTPPTESSDPGTPAGPGASLSWEADIPFTNRFVFWDVARWSLLTTVLAEGLLIGVAAWTGELGSIATPEVLGGVVAAVLGLCLLGYALTALLLGNAYQGRYTITSEGVGFHAGRKVRRLHRAAMGIALLSGRPAPIGAAVVARSQELQWYPWQDIRRVAVHRGARVISLTNAWRVVLRLYCPPERFEEIVSLVEQYTGAATGRRPD